MKPQMLERNRRSQIFDTILKDVESDDLKKKNVLLEKRKTQTVQLAAATGLAMDVAPMTEQASAQKKAERAFDHQDFETAAQEYERCLLYAERNQTNPVELIALFLAQGSSLQSCNRHDEAGEAYDRAQEVFENGASISMHDQRVDIETHRATLAVARGQLSQAETHYVDALNHYEEECSVESAKMAHLLCELGAVYTEAGHFDKAMEVVLEAVTNLEASAKPASEQRLHIFKQLASIAFKKQESTAAVNHLLEAYKWARELNNFKEMIELEVTLATVYTQHQEFETAKEWFQTAIKRHETTDAGDNWPLSLLYANLALVQAQTTGDPAAGDFFSRSLDLQMTHMATHSVAA